MFQLDPSPGPDPRFGLSERNDKLKRGHSLLDTIIDVFHCHIFEHYPVTEITFVARDDGKTDRTALVEVSNEMQLKDCMAFPAPCLPHPAPLPVLVFSQSRELGEAVFH